MPIRSVGTEFTVNTTLYGDQDSPEIHWLNGGRFIAFWQSDDLWPRENAYFEEPQDVLRARVFEPDGTATGKDFVFNQAEGGSGIASIQQLESGGFLAQWATGDWETSGIDNYAGAFDRNGQPAGEEFQLPFYDWSSLTRLSEGHFVSAGWDFRHPCDPS